MTRKKKKYQGITVGELIAKLQEFPSETPVGVLSGGFESEATSATEISFGKFWDAILIDDIEGVLIQ